MSAASKYPIVRLETLAADRRNAMVGGPFGSNLVSRDYTAEGVPVIRGTNIAQSKYLSSDGFVFVSERKADELRTNNAHPGDIVFTQRGTLGQVGIIPRDAAFSRYVISQSQMKMTVALQKASVDYLYYYFRMPSMISYIENHALQSGVPHINLGILKRFEVVLPPLPTQRKIAAILTAYDDLIETNKRRIALLEKMAEELYREWFVRMRFPGHQNTRFVKGVPEGWVVRELQECAEVNSSCLGRNDRPEVIHYVDIGSVTTNKIGDVRTLPLSEAPGRAKRRVQHGDIIWSSVRPSNRAYCLIYKPIENLIVSTGFAVIRPKAETPFTFLNFVVTSNGFVDQMTAVAKGAAYPATSFDDFEKAKLLWPGEDLLAAFHERCEPLFHQKHNLTEQNRTLSQTRDLLLPRLISGKLLVEDLDIQFPPNMREEVAEPAHA